MINSHHLRDLVVRPALQAMDMGGEDAVELLMGTAYQESRLTHLHQLGAGPAVGLWQMEPATAADLVHRYLETRRETDRSFQAGFQVVNSSQIDWGTVRIEAVAIKLVSDLRFACAMARLRFRMVPEALPDRGDPWAMGAYWKQYYNTPAGAGTAEEFAENYRHLVVLEG